MEIIEEDVEKEGYGTDFKRGSWRAGRMLAEKNEDGAADQHSNKSSPVRQNVAAPEETNEPILDRPLGGCMEVL